LDEDTTMEVRSFFDLYKRTLRLRLKEKLDAYCHNSLSVHVFDPCEAVTFGRCDRKDCQRQHKLNHTWFDNRLHFHMCQISILTSLRFIGMGLGIDLRFDPVDLRRFDLAFHPLSPLTIYSEVSGSSGYTTS
jgi:hypothetical protein